MVVRFISSSSRPIFWVFRIHTFASFLSLRWSKNVLLVCSWIVFELCSIFNICSTGRIIDCYNLERWWGFNTTNFIMRETYGGCRIPHHLSKLVIVFRNLFISFGRKSTWLLEVVIIDVWIPLFAGTSIVAFRSLWSFIRSNIYAIWFGIILLYTSLIILSYLNQILVQF